MAPIIEISNLGKKYTLVHDKVPYRTLRDTVANFAKNPFAPRQQHETFWALKDINLNINKGDIVGIIGKNGAGKSTLLKILSGITKPTEGKVKLYGRVSSLLEVGTGFHPELTGRENIFMNGVILGMTRAEIAKKFDEIVAFAGIEKFLDTPVKHYSSGMYVRLAFAVAAHLEPDILIVDEVLAVGDAEFQKKCLGKMGEISKEEGRTVIFVSHDLVSIEHLCRKTILLKKGMVEMFGNTSEVTSFYLNDIRKRTGSEKIWNDQYPGDDNVKFTAIRLLNKDKQRLQTVFAEDPIYVEIEYEIIKPTKNIQIGFWLKKDLHVVFESGDLIFPRDEHKIRDRGKYSSICMIPENLLNSNKYSLTLMAHIPNVEIVAREEDIISFLVSTKRSMNGWKTQPGLLRPMFKWEINRK